MQRLLNIITRTLREQRLLDGVDHLLVGISGGADSVAMACALAALRESFPVRLSLVHLNHQIRGADADEDEAFVHELADSLGLDCVSARRDVPSLARATGVSLEMAARQARQDFFREQMTALHAQAVATAHTVDDQVETILLRLFRGCGLLGLAGIPYLSEIKGLTLIRPLRDASRQDVLQFLLDRGRSWREDASNQSPDHLRNRVRHEVLPLIEERVNPRVRSALLRMSNIVRADNDWLDASVGASLSGCLLSGKGLALGVERLAHLPLAEQRRVILKWLADQRVDQQLLDAETVRRIGQLTLGMSGSKTVPLRAGWEVTRIYDQIILNRRGGGGRRESPFRVELPLPGEILIPEASCLARTDRATGIIRQHHAQIGQFPLHASLLASAVGDAPLILRPWRHGDIFRPLGLEGRKKVQDIFVNLKIPRPCRATWPLLECRNQLIWIPGYRIARGFELPDEKSPAIHISLLPAPTPPVE